MTGQAVMSGDQRDKSNWAFPVCQCGCGNKTKRYGARHLRGHKPRQPLADRLWPRLLEAGSCWIWSGSTSNAGYGQIWDEQARRVKLAHRVAFELTHGPIVDDMLVCHRCDNPPCCNPEHRFLGTQKDNMRDSVLKARQPDRRGEGNGRSRLSLSDVAAIRRLAADGMPHRGIAGRFGISRKYVGEIARNEAWRTA